MTDRRWETRLIAVVAAVLVVFGLAAVYGASSLVTVGGSAFALRQALGAGVGGLVAATLARSDYRAWQRFAWPVLGVAALLHTALGQRGREFAPGRTVVFRE